MGSLRMLFYVVECFSVNLEKLPANAVGGVERYGVDEKVERQGGFVAIPLSKTPHEVYHVGALDPQGAQVGNHAAKLRGLVFDSLLEVAQAGDGLIRGERYLAPEDIELDFDAEQCLEYTVVEVTRYAAAFPFDGAGAQVPEEKNILERGTDVSGDALEPAKIFLSKGLAAIGKKNPADRLAFLIEGYRHQGAELELLLRGTGEARQGLKFASIAAVPAKAGALPNQRVPADGGVHVVQQKAILAGQRKAFR